MESDKRQHGLTIALSSIALAISVLSAVFSGLQWREARESRLQQKAAAESQDSFSRKQELLNQSLAMSAERTALTTQNKKEQPKITISTESVPYGNRLILFGEKSEDLTSAFFTRAKTVTIRNEGVVNAYDVKSVAAAQLSSPNGEILMRHADSDPILIFRPGDQVYLAIREHPEKEDDRKDFAKGLLHYYVSARAEYRDAFQHAFSVDTCKVILVENRLSFEEKDCVKQ